MDLITKSLLCTIMEDRVNRRRSAKCMVFLTKISMEAEDNTSLRIICNYLTISFRICIRDKRRSLLCSCVKNIVKGFITLTLANFSRMLHPSRSCYVTQKNLFGWVTSGNVLQFHLQSFHNTHMNFRILEYIYPLSGVSKQNSYQYLFH